MNPSVRIRNMDTTRRMIAGVAGLAMALLGGCLSVPIPQAEADPSRFYVLNTTSPAAAAKAGAPTVHLQPVEVASYLRSRTMVVRRGENEIQFREFARWGEPLELGVARVLREELLARGAASTVTSGVRMPGETNAFALSVRVLACEGGADGMVLFRAAWELAPAGGKTGAGKGGEFRAADLRWDGKTEASLAAQLSVAVAGLAGEIAAALQ
jgi:uncharacterized lipoprotein YmbA